MWLNESGAWRAPVGSRTRRGPFVAIVVCASCLGIAAIVARQAPTFRSGVEVVLVDVAVVDRTGRPVGTLGPADFAVRVDGRSRTIVSAQFLEYETRTTTERGAAAVRDPTVAAPSSPPPPRIVLIVIDEDSMEPGDGLVVKQAARRFLDKLAPNDRIGVVTIPRLRSAVTVSTRRSDARKALDAVITGVTIDRYLLNIGLAEAFDIERKFSDVLARVVARECGRSSIPDCPLLVQMEARQMQIQAHLRGRRSLDALFALADGLASVEGPKTVLLVSGGMPMPDLSSADAFSRIEAAFAAGQVSLYTLYMERSSLGQVKNAPSPTALDDDLIERDGIENATSAAGGTLMLAIGSLDQYVDRVVTELSGSYLLGVEVAPSDRDGRTHQVDVKVNRAGLAVRARKRYVIEPARAAAASDLKRAAAREARSKPSAPPPLTVELVTPDVEAAVARAATYATNYETELSGLVAEEQYIQKSFKYEKLTVTSTTSAGRGRPQTTTQEEGEWVLDARRVLKSDYLLVKAPGGERWLPFRDVFEVDGKRVREREERLQHLFLKAPATAADRAIEIMAEGARYNIGFVERNVNLPTFALQFLDPEYRGRTLFRKTGEATIAGTRTWAMAFAERGTPTIVRDGSADVPADGTFWIDPRDGRVVRSAMRLAVRGVTVEITVTYKANPKAGSTWLPSEMREVYLANTRRVECLATYSKVRRFQVSTGEVQKAPRLRPRLRRVNPH